MSNTDRRAFLRRGAAITAGVALLGDRTLAGEARAAVSHGSLRESLPDASGPALMVTVRGLCVFVLRKNKTVDLVLMNHEQRMAPPKGQPMIHEHAARLIVDSGHIIEKADGVDIGDKLVSWKLRGYRVSIKDVPAQAETAVAFASIENPWQSFQWLLDLGRAFPAGRLWPDLNEGGQNRAASIIQLRGGSLEGLVPSSGLGNVAVWEMRSREAEPQTWRQSMTDQAMYRLPLPAATRQLAISRTPLNGTPGPAPADIVLAVSSSPASEPLSVAIDHTYRAETPTNQGDSNAMPHNVVFYDVFENAPAVGPYPTQMLRIGERMPPSERTEHRLQVNDADPYCNMAFYREPAQA